MSRICSWLYRFASRALEPQERAAVGGDLIECGDSPAQAVRGVVGLVVRRQIAIWQDWQPWLAFFGIVGVSAYLLSALVFQFDLTFYMRLRGYLSEEIFYNFRTDGEEITYLVTLGFAVFLWSWVSTFLLATLSRRATWLTFGLFYLVVVNANRMSLIVHGNLHLNIPPHFIVLFVLSFFIPMRSGVVFLFMIPAFWALRQSRRGIALTIRQSNLVAAAVVLLTGLVTWTSGFYGKNREAMSHGMYHAVSWPSRLLPLLVLSWPVIWIVVVAARQNMSERSLVR